MEGGLFVQPSPAVKWFGANSNGVPLSDLKVVPCLVLLGDVGMGKSTTIKNEAEGIKATLAGPRHAVVYQDLKRLSEAQIERRIFQNPEVASWLRGEHALTLFLDSLDECWRRIDALELLLVGELESRIRKETPPLFLRLTCRSAEWRGDAGKTLERLFSRRTESNPPVQIFVLAPLSANNVREAAQCNSLDGDRLLERITAKRLSRWPRTRSRSRCCCGVSSSATIFPAHVWNCIERDAYVFVPTNTLFAEYRCNATRRLHIASL